MGTFEARPDARRRDLGRDAGSAADAVMGGSGGVAEVVEALLDDVEAEAQRQRAPEGDGLRGRVAIVTGASRGIGRAVALGLAESGTDVSFCFLDSGSKARIAAQEVAGLLREAEVRVYFRACDVRDSADVRRFVAETHAELGAVHVLVNNAGIARDQPLWDMQDHEWDAVVRTNLDGAFFFTRAVAPIMRGQEYGKIVNVGSILGTRTTAGVSNYAASKAAIVGFTRSSAVELGPSNINVNAVAPGYIRTSRLTQGVPPEVLDRAREQSALRRLGDPQDVSNVVLFLCSEAARHITGAVIPVDGGYAL